MGISKILYSHVVRKTVILYTTYSVYLLYSVSILVSVRCTFYAMYIPNVQTWSLPLEQLVLLS